MNLGILAGLFSIRCLDDKMDHLLYDSINEIDNSQTYTFQIEKICKSYYTIHGLWPNFGFYCPNKPFNLTKLEPIGDQLEEYWPSCFHHSNEWLWKHEWTKHGSCIPDMDELQYFQKALDLRDQYDDQCKTEVCNLCFDMNFRETVCSTDL